MKKLNLKGKLSLNKETIAKLTNQQMAEIEGGTTGRTCLQTCYPNATCNPPGGNFTVIDPLVSFFTDPLVSLQTDPLVSE